MIHHGVFSNSIMFKDAKLSYLPQLPLKLVGLWFGIWKSPEIFDTLFGSFQMIAFLPIQLGPLTHDSK